MQGFKELIKKRPKKSKEESMAMPSEGMDDMRPRLYLRDEQLPGVLKDCELGKKYLVEVEMSSKEVREKSNTSGSEETVSADFIVTAFNPKPEDGKDS